MNQAEKEAYLREYSILKNEGKPFFPYAVVKDSIMAVIVVVSPLEEGPVAPTPLVGGSTLINCSPASNR